MMRQLLGPACCAVGDTLLLSVVVNYIIQAQLSTAKQAKKLGGHLLLSAPVLEANTIYQTLLRPGFLPAHSLARSQGDVHFIRITSSQSNMDWIPL